MSSRGTSRYKKPKRTTITIPEQTPRTTAFIQSTTGRTSTGTIIDRSRYHRIPTLKKKEEVDEGLSIQSIGAVIGTGAKVVAQAAKTVTLKLPTTPAAKKIGRRGIAPGVSAAVGIQEQKGLPTQSTSLFTGEAIPEYDDESYMEGPKDLLDIKGYSNILHGLTVPTKQMVQMGKDIMEGVPEEKRTMYESSLDLAIMPILGPLIGQKEYGIGKEAYEPWEFGFADPRNIFTGTMAHNLGVAGYALQQPEFYDAVSHEMGVSAEKWEKHKPYYIATTTGELPYFMLGLGEGAMGARLALKSAAMGTRYTSGAAGPIARTIGTDVGRASLATRGEQIAMGIESAPTRIAHAVRKWRTPPQFGIRFKYASQLGSVETIEEGGKIKYKEQWGQPMTLENVKEVGAGEIQQFQEMGMVRTGFSLEPAMGVAPEALGMAKGAAKGESGYRWSKWQSGRLKEWLYRRAHGKQKEQMYLADMYSRALPEQVPLEGTYFLSKLGEIQHDAGAVTKAKAFVRADRAGNIIGFGTYKGTKQEFAAPGRYISADRGGFEENMLKYLYSDDALTPAPTLPRAIHKTKWKAKQAKPTKMMVGLGGVLKRPAYEEMTGFIGPLSPMKERIVQLHPLGMLDKVSMSAKETQKAAEMGYLKPTAALAQTKETEAILNASALAKVYLEGLKVQAGKNIKDASVIGRTKSGQAMPAPGEISDVYWATGLERTTTALATEKYRPQDVIRVGAGYYQKGVSSQVQRRIWQPGGRPKDLIPGESPLKPTAAPTKAEAVKQRKLDASDQYLASMFELPDQGKLLTGKILATGEDIPTPATDWMEAIGTPIGKAKAPKPKQRYVPEDLFATIEGMRMVKEPSFQIWRPPGVKESKLMRRIPSPGPRKDNWTPLDIRSGWDVLQDKYGTGIVRSIRSEVLAPTTPPLKQLREAFDEGSIRITGLREPVEGKPGTKQARDFDRFKELQMNIAKEEKNRIEEQKLVGLGYRSNKLGHMDDVSWYEIMHDKRYGVYRKYFKDNLPAVKKDTPKVIALKEKYQRTVAATRPDRFDQAESKLRELGNKISKEMYGEEGPSKHKITVTEERTIYEKGATGARKVELKDDLAKLVKEDQKWFPDDTDKTSRKRRIKMERIENELRGDYKETVKVEVPKTTNVVDDAQRRFAADVNQGIAGKGWKTRVRKTVPLVAQKKIRAIEERIKGYEKEKKNLVDRSPIVVGAPSIIQKIDPTDYGMAAQTSKEWRMTGARVRHTGEGYPKKHFTIEMSDKDKLVHYHSYLTRKTAIARGYEKGSLTEKTKGKKSKIPWKGGFFRRKEPEDVGVTQTMQAKTDPITAEMLLGSKTQDGPRATKIIAIDFDGTNLLADKKQQRMLGIRPTIYETGKELIEKTTRPGSLYFKTMLRKVRRSYTRSLREPETVEDKPTYWMSSVDGDAVGLTLKKVQAYMDSGYVTVGGKGAHVERHNKILGHRLRAFGGESEYQVLEQIKAGEKSSDKIVQSMKSITDEQAEMTAKVERKAAAEQLASGILKDEQRLDWTGFYTKGVGSNWYAFKKGHLDPGTIRSFDIDEITVKGVKTTTGAEAVKKLERIQAKEKVHERVIKELKEQEQSAFALVGRQKGKHPDTGVIPAQMVPETDPATGARIPLRDSKGQQIIDSESGKPKWKMTEKIDAEGFPIAKKTRTVGVKSTPEQVLDWIEHERAQVGMEEYKGNAARFESMRLKAEYQKKLINPDTGEPTVNPQNAEAYIKDYDMMNRTLNEQDSVRSVTQTLRQFIDDNPNWSEGKIPGEKKLAKDRLKDTVIRLAEKEKELSEAEDVGTAGFDLLQAHVDLLRDNKAIFRTRVQSMVVSEKYWKKLKAEGEREQATAARGMPDAAIKQIASVQINLKKAKGSQRYTRRDRYVLGEEIYNRIKARTRQEKVELFFSDDFLKNQPFHTKERIAADKPVAHTIRIKRGKIEASIAEDNLRLVDLEIEKQGHLTNEIRMYAKLNLERKLYDKMKIIKEDPLAPEEVSIEVSDLAKRIRDLDNNHSMEDLLRIAKEGDEGIMMIPARFTKKVTIDELEFNELTQTMRGVKQEHTLVDPDKFIKINKDYKKILWDHEFGATGKRKDLLLQEIKELKSDFTDEYAKKEFAGSTNKESLDLRAERLQQKQDALEGVQWLKPKDDKGRTIRGAKPVRIEAKITDEEFAKEPGNIEGTIHQMQKSRNFWESTQDSGTRDVLSIKTLHETIGKRQIALDMINKEARDYEKKYGVGAATHPRWQKYAAKKTDYTNQFGEKIQLDSFPEESLYTTWTKHRYTKAAKRMAETYKRGEYLKLKQSLDTVTIKLAASKAKLTYIQTLPDKYRNFSMESRGIVWKYSDEVLKRQIPREKPSRVIHWVSETGDGKEYIYTKGQFYELPEGYWEGVGSVGSAESKGVKALTMAERQKLFKTPLQKVRQFTEEKRKSFQGKVLRLEQKVGIEPSDAEKMDALKSGKVPGYIVADTPLAKLLDRVGIRGGTGSRFGSRFTGSSNIGVMGDITDRFLEDLDNALMRKGRVHGAKQITTKDYELYTPVKGSTKTAYEKKYPLARLFDEDDPTKQLPADVRKDRVYQVTATIPQFPTEIPQGIERLLGTQMKQPFGTTQKLLEGKGAKLRQVIESRKMDPDQEPFLAPMGEKEVHGLADVYPVKEGGEFTPGGTRVMGLGEDVKKSIRQHISYRFVRDVLNFKTKKGYGPGSGSFIDPEGTKTYQTMVNYEDVFLSLKDELDTAIRRPTYRETGESLYGTIDTAARKGKDGWINVFEIPVEGVKAAEGRMFRGKLTSVSDMLYFRKFVSKEARPDPYAIAKHQALLRMVRDEGIPLQKADKEFLKLKPRFSVVDVAAHHIDTEMKLKYGSKFAARDWLEWDWRAIAKKDPTWKSQAGEINKIEALQGKKRTVNSEISKLQTKRRELEQKLGVKYDKTAASELQPDVWYRLKDRKKGHAKYRDAHKDRLVLQQTYKDLEGKYKHVENLDKGILGYYKDSTTGSGNYVHTLLRDVQPAPIMEKGELGKPTGKILGYEETPFTGLSKDKPLATGELGSPAKSKIEIYHEWLNSEARTGVYTRNHPAVKAGTAHVGDRIVITTRAKKMVTTEATPKGRRFLSEEEQKGLRFTTKDEPYKVTTTYDPEFRTHAEEFSLGEINLGDDIDPNIISQAHIRELQMMILKKKLTKDGVKNTKKNIENYQKELKELEGKDVAFADTTIGRARKKQHENELDSTKRSLQRELNTLGTHRNIETKGKAEYTPVDVADINRGTYTVEKGKNIQAVILAETERVQMSPQAVRPLTAPLTIAGKTGSPSVLTPRGVGSMYPSTEPVMPEAAAVLEQKRGVEVKALAPIIQPRPQQVGDIIGVGSWLRDSSKMITGAVTDLTTKEDAKLIFPHVDVVGTLLYTKEKGVILEKQVIKPKLRIPEPVKQRLKPEEPKFLARVVRPPRIRPVPPIVFGWLDPAERAKRLAKLKKKKKKKIAWAAPKVWFHGEGYYFKGGAAYTAFAKTEPRQVRQLDKKLGETKWSERRTKSMFDIRPFKGKKVNPYRDQTRKKVKKKPPKRTDMFGPTSTSRKGY